MRLWKDIYAFIRGGTSGFNPLETTLLSAIISRLPFAEAAKLEKRIGQVNLVQRLDGGREVNCYYMRGGRPVLDDAVRISKIEGEHVVARFSFVSNGHRFSGRMLLVNGVFFSMLFDAPTEHVVDANVEDLSVVLDLAP